MTKTASTINTDAPEILIKARELGLHKVVELFPDDVLVAAHSAHGVKSGDGIEANAFQDIYPIQPD